MKLLRYLLIIVFGQLSACAIDEKNPSYDEIFKTYGFRIDKPFENFNVGTLDCRRHLRGGHSVTPLQQFRNFCMNQPDQNDKEPRVMFAWKNREMTRNQFTGMVASTILFWRSGNKGVVASYDKIKCEVAKNYVTSNKLGDRIVDCLLSTSNGNLPYSIFHFEEPTGTRRMQAVTVVDWRNSSTEGVSQVRKLVREIARSIQPI